MWTASRRFLGQFNRDLWVLSAGWFVGALGFAASVPFIAIYFHEHLGLSPLEIGYFFAVLAVMRSVSQAIGGEISDRIGRRPLLIHSQILRAVTFFFLALAISYDLGFWWVGSLMLLNAVVGSAFFPAVNAMVSDILPAEQRMDGYAISRAAGNLGWGAGPALGGFLAASSYASLFHISAVITLVSALIFWKFLKPEKRIDTGERFKLADIVEVRRNRNFSWHLGLTFVIYLVHAQLIMPFSLYTVEVAGISETALGWLFTANGLIVVLLQIPVTRMLAPFRFTTQLAVGSLIYLVGYGIVGMHGGFMFFLLTISIVTMGELFISPASLTLTSKLAPPGRMGRYMGVHGFFVTAGWSLGPLYGGFFLNSMEGMNELIWIAIASLAIVPAFGYWLFSRRLPAHLDGKEVAGSSIDQ